MFKSKRAFTLIELLVVIAIIGVLATVSIIALSNARSKSRDAKRVGNMKQVQTALELFFNDNGRYPTEEEWALGSLFSTTSSATTTYLQVIPTSPIPADGNCSENENTSVYTQTESGASYSVAFCIGNTTGAIAPGNKTLTPAGIIAVGGGEETPPAEFACGEDVLTDTRDSQTYTTILIGTQCWMAENLNYGDMILSSASQTDNSAPEKHCYNNNAANCATYGGLYQWNEAMQYVVTEGSQGLCPTGWHVPSSDDFYTLLLSLGNPCDIDANDLSGCPQGGTLKEAGTSHWTSPNTGATNSSGFTVLPAGITSSGDSYLLGDYEILITSTSDSGQHKTFSLIYNTSLIQRNETGDTGGFSVRCLQNQP
ncbi:MAG: FISUMP domain-containing protein [Patescibacteria group bacterium]|jgi:uncharacterized protein (TIGR02145 family)/prepilin-type N-terminal cleavage/methylation domain-containing protein